MSIQKIAELERQIVALTEEVGALRKAAVGEPARNHVFSTLGGETTLLDLFGERDQLLVIQNMGQSCRYCTLWADGLNGLLPHLESAFAVALVSKDAPTTQRRFANERGWRFQLASHGDGDYMREEAAWKGEGQSAGAVLYERDGDAITRKNACVFGPGDLYCAMWPLLALAGLDGDAWTPQYAYWKRPAKLDDGGLNIAE